MANARRIKVLIVGGGPAGLSTALFLASRRPEWVDRIVVLEKARYPREKFCAGAIGSRADRKLGSIDVRIDVPSVAVDGARLTTSYGTQVTKPGAIGRVVRRIEFDHALALRTRERGITVVEGAQVTKIERAGGALRVVSSAGSFDAETVVGADGIGGVTRRAIGLPAGRVRAQVIECDTPIGDGDDERSMLSFDLSNRSLRGYAWDFPTLIDGKPLMCRGVYQLRDGASTGRDIRDHLERHLRLKGLEIEGLPLKRFSERGFDWPGPLSAERVLLVGEAAGIDGLTGEGIAQGVEYAMAAADYLVERIEGGKLSFGDWRREMSRRIVGVDLVARRLALDLLYGRTRPFVERWIGESPSMARTAIARFAGGPPQPIPAAYALKDGLVALVRTLAFWARSP